MWNCLIINFHSIFFILFIVLNSLNFFKTIHFILSNFLLINIFNIEIDFFFTNYYNFFTFNYYNFISLNLFTNVTINYLFIEKTNFFLNNITYCYNFYIDLLNKHLDFTLFNLIFNLTSSYNLILTNFNINRISFYLEFSTLNFLHFSFFSLLISFSFFKKLFKF